jgi:vacuolar-type H+-ATPase subunit H
MNFVLESIVTVEKEAQKILEQARLAQAGFEQQLARKEEQLQQEFKQSYQTEIERYQKELSQEETRKISLLQKSYAQKREKLETYSAEHCDQWAQEIAEQICKG